MLIPSSPDYKLDPDLKRAVRLLSLTLPSAGLQPLCSGQLARSATLLCHQAASHQGEGFPQLSKQKWKRGLSSFFQKALLANVINFGLSFPSHCFPSSTPSRQLAILGWPSWKFDGTVYHQPNVRPCFACVLEEPAGQLRRNKALFVLQDYHQKDMSSFW